MKCKCNIEMKHLTDEYDGRENKMNEIHWCVVCGRIYYHYTTTKYEDVDFWMEPSILEAMGE